jgi:crossover junction endodeoxyribonuclease RuvC
LGVDPGLQNFGYAIIEHAEELKLICAGEILTQKEDPKRLVKIFDAISDIIKVYNPDLCAIERTFVNPKNPFSSLNLGQARGIILLCFQLFDKKYIEIAPTSIKKNICGKSGASKVEIQSYVNGLFDVSLNSNASDAIAICLCAGEKDLHK